MRFTLLCTPRNNNITYENPKTYEELVLGLATGFSANTGSSSDAESVRAIFISVFATSLRTCYEGGSWMRAERVFKRLRSAREIVLLLIAMAFLKVEG